MYGLHTKIDTTLFRGLELESITFTENTIHISMGAGVAVTSLTSVAYQLTRAGELHIDALPVTTSALMQLVGAAIEEASRTESGGLLLTLVDGQEITIEDESDAYESFSVTTPDREFVV